MIMAHKGLQRKKPRNPLRVSYRDDAYAQKGVRTLLVRRELLCFDKLQGS